MPQWYESGKIYAEAHPEVPQREYPNSDANPQPHLHRNATPSREYHRANLITPCRLAACTLIGTVPSSPLRFRQRMQVSSSPLVLHMRCLQSTSGHPRHHACLSFIQKAEPRDFSLTPVCVLTAAALLFTELLLVGWAESKRLADYNNPGSQGDGSFFGITDGLKGQDNGYPGASWKCPFVRLSSSSSHSRGLPKAVLLDSAMQRC